MPSKKNEVTPQVDEASLRKSLEEIIVYIEEATSTRFDIHFAETVTFTCGKCGQRIARNSKLLNDNDIVQCQNPNCIVSYITQKTGENFTFKPYLLDFKCHSCGHEHFVEANALLKLQKHEGQILSCQTCGAKHLVTWTLQLRPHTSDG